MMFKEQTTEKSVGIHSVFSVHTRSDRVLPCFDLLPSLMNWLRRSAEGGGRPSKLTEKTSTPILAESLKKHLPDMPSHLAVADIHPVALERKRELLDLSGFPVIFSRINPFATRLSILSWTALTAQLREMVYCGRAFSE